MPFIFCVPRDHDLYSQHLTNHHLCAYHRSALEETAAYAIIAEIEQDRVSLFLGICEISTGVGYMIGPPLGGLLFFIGEIILASLAIAKTWFR